jgi:predicted RNA-binding protein with PIN domain
VDSLFIIDGFNVLHAGILTGRDRANWWRAEIQRRLVARVEQFSQTQAAELWIVFDRGSDRHSEKEDVDSDDPRIHVFYAPSADDWIVSKVEAWSSQRTITVVTADRLLRERVCRAGGMLSSPMQFLARCG